MDEKEKRNFLILKIKLCFLISLQRFQTQMFLYYHFSVSKTPHNLPWLSWKTISSDSLIKQGLLKLFLFFCWLWQGIPETSAISTELVQLSLWGPGQWVAREGCPHTSFVYVAAGTAVDEAHSRDRQALTWFNTALLWAEKYSHVKILLAEPHPAMSVLFSIPSHLTQLWCLL